MHSIQNIKIQLTQLLELLIREREALIKNDGNAVAGIVEKKMDIVQKLESIGLHTVEANEQLKNIAIEIQEVQETNLLLTRQALKFQESLIESVAANLKNVANVYSGKGGYENNNQSINLVDQEI